MFPKKTKMLFTCSIFSSISSSLSSQRIVATKAPSLSSVASGGGSAGFDFWAASPHTASSSLKPLSFTQNLGTSPQQAMSIACGGGRLKGIIRPQFGCLGWGGGMGGFGLTRPGTQLVASSPACPEPEPTPYKPSTCSHSSTNTSTDVPNLLRLGWLRNLLTAPSSSLGRYPLCQVSLCSQK